MDIKYLGLPKWPALVVSGDPVTREQAREILVRTDGWHLSTNDRDWKRQVELLIGAKPADDYRKDWEAVERFRDEIGALQLNYLDNRRIMSSYIGGPHGWCDWDGHIGCNTYNIGKWPSIAEVEADWREIAREFPFLNLWSHLYSGEQCEEGTVPVIEFVVSGGTVEIREPDTTRQVRPRSEDNASVIAGFVANLWSPGRERGCNIETLRSAIAQVRAKFQSELAYDR